ncbi:TetR family transcriptional regulator [Agromyces sp. CFH 90414]|uniref:TetR family transcriptional regulator n=1 Tax=Agromyces agglutinans TaxID=2662258 RepID=A0A6I2FAJ8_9MICO|nr:TetR/AcrR family transcriptional regulator [Agromyces agglutinans]MRG59750.1 TetR family transcriptional regulator [Agromyces agglutinans]
MARRGSYAKGVAKREEILATALDVIARNGYGRASVRELADAVGLSQAGLLHYFTSKELLFAEVLRTRDEVDASAYATDDDPDITRYSRIIRHNADVPGLVQLYVRLSAEATDPGHPAHAFFADRSATFRREVAVAMREAQAAGRVDPGLDADRLTLMLLALADGLQTQWLMDPAIDMAAHIDEFFALVAGPSA